MYVGTSDWRVLALDATTGALKWDNELDYPIISAPEAVENLVYVGVRKDSRGSNSTVYALDSATGEIRWRVACDVGEPETIGRSANGLASIPSPLDVYSSPTVAGGMVYFGSSDHHVHALDAATGEVQWCFRTGESVHFAPVVVSGIAYVSSSNGYFYALDALNGEVLWHYRTGRGAISSLVVEDDVVFVNADNDYIFALSPPKTVVQGQ